MGSKRRRHYRYQVLGAALTPPLAVIATSLFTDLSVAWVIGLSLVLGLGSLLSSLVVWRFFGDTLRANGWEW